MLITGIAEHAALFVIVTDTLSLFFNDVVVKTGELIPATILPFICQVYMGDAPPLTGVAVKVTGVFSQIEVDGAEMDTEEGESDVMVTVKLFSSEHEADVPAYT